MKSQNYLIILLFFLSTGCMSVQGLHNFKSKKRVADAIFSIDSAKAANSNIPTKEEYVADRAAFIVKMENILSVNNAVIAKYSGRQQTYSIIGAIVGGAGGIIGLVSTNNKVGSVTSILTGTLVGIGGAAVSQPGKARASECVKALQSELNTFESSWTLFNRPTTTVDADNYISSKKDLIAKIDKANCFAPDGGE